MTRQRLELAKKLLKSVREWDAEWLEYVLSEETAAGELVMDQETKPLLVEALEAYVASAVNHPTSKTEQA